MHRDLESIQGWNFKSSIEIRVHIRNKKINVCLLFVALTIINKGVD